MSEDLCNSGRAGMERGLVERCSGRSSNTQKLSDVKSAAYEDAASLRAFAAQRWRAASLSSDEPRLALVTDDAGTAMTVLSQLRNSAH
jgi:hypothetical protein